MVQNVKEVPYGVSDFRTMVEQNIYYVDKTMYIPELEKQARYIIFIRPRRFGKSVFWGCSTLTMTAAPKASSNSGSATFG